MDRRQSELGILIELIHIETRFYRPYEGQVVDNQDPDAKGKVRVMVPGLNQFSASEGMWCQPEYIDGAINVPPVGSWVKVFFMAGDRKKPYYGGRLGAITDSQPKNISNDIEIIHESKDGKMLVAYNTQNQKLGIGGDGEIILQDGTKEVARKDDTVSSSMTEDSIFWTWLAAAAVVLTGLGVVVPSPTSLASKITSGASKVKA